MSNLNPEITRRRTFAIISHPDAGKTTLTEKLLLFGGQIQEDFPLCRIRLDGNRKTARYFSNDLCDGV